MKCLLNLLGSINTFFHVISIFILLPMSVNLAYSCHYLLLNKKEQFDFLSDFDIDKLINLKYFIVINLIVLSIFLIF